MTSSQKERMDMIHDHLNFVNQMIERLDTKFVGTAFHCDFCFLLAFFTTVIRKPLELVCSSFFLILRVLYRFLSMCRPFYSVLVQSRHW